MSLQPLNDLYNHGFGNGGGSGIGRHMLMYRSHHGSEATTYPIIILKYYQSIIAGPNFDDITVVNAVTGEVIVGKPELVGDDSIKMVTSNGRPLEYGETYQVNIPDGALYDKRKLPLSGGYFYSFTVDIDHSIIYSITEDMTGEDINTLINTVSGNKFKLPYGVEINVGNTPIKYPNGLVIYGKGSITSNVGINVFEPEVPGKCKLTLEDVNVNGPLIGEWLDLRKCTINSLTVSQQYDLAEDADIVLEYTGVTKNFDLTGYSEGNVVCSHSTISPNKDGKVIFCGENIRLRYVNIDSALVIFDSIDVDIYISNFEDTKFDITDIAGMFHIQQSSIISNDSIIIRTDSEKSIFIDSEVRVENCTISITTTDSDTGDVIVIDGKTLPSVSLHDCIINGARNVVSYTKSDLTEYENIKDPLLIMANNVIDDANLVYADTAVTIYIGVQILNNNTRAILTLPSAYFRGMVNSNLVLDNKLTMRPDLMVRNNVILGG